MNGEEGTASTYTRIFAATGCRATRKPLMIITAHGPQTSIQYRQNAGNQSIQRLMRRCQRRSTLPVNLLRAQMMG